MQILKAKVWWSRTQGLHQIQKPFFQCVLTSSHKLSSSEHSYSSHLQPLDSQSSIGTFQHMSSPRDLATNQTVIRGKHELQLDAAALRIVHCSADSSSTDTMSRRQQVVQAVHRPVRKGSQHCVNVLKELLPQEVSTAKWCLQLHVLAGSKPCCSRASITCCKCNREMCRKHTCVVHHVAVHETYSSAVLTVLSLMSSVASAV